MTSGSQPEEPIKPNWRAGYQEHEHEWVLQIQDWRARKFDKVFPLSTGEGKLPRDMTDDDVADAAREMAKRDMERAINEYNRSEERRKGRENDLYRELKQRRSERLARRLIDERGYSEPAIREIARECELPVERVREYVPTFVRQG